MGKVLLTTFLLFLVAFNLAPSGYGEKLVPCYFIFGDSLVDNGNNNDRNTVAKANFLPYGIDYPNGQTGRFSNGRNVADFIAEALGFSDHIPAFARARATGDDTILNGVNYASGAAGILSGTGKQFGDVISLDEQVKNHESTVKRIISILGNDDAAKNHLGKCIYSVGMGSNDYAAYTMNPFRPTPDHYASQLIHTYSTQLRELYALGARKVALFGLGTIGCVPAAKFTYGPMCLSATKATSGVFNTNLRSLVDVLNRDLVGAQFTYIDTFGITISDPATNGFKYPNVECCTVSAAGMCVAQSVACSNRADYAYFDGYHPTEAAAAIVANRAFAASSPSDVYPFDIQHLAS